MQSDFSELILNDSIGNAPTRWDFSELILNDLSLLLGTREYVRIAALLIWEILLLKKLQTHELPELGLLRVEKRKKCTYFFLIF